MSTSYATIPSLGATFSSDTRSHGSVATTFDTFIYKPVHRFSQLKLSIKLRINLRQLPPRVVPMQQDSTGKPFWTIPWSAPDWQRFVSGAAVQADMWNNKFWLVPPATFTDFDQSMPGSQPGRVWRPNIRCALDVDFNASENPHLTVDAANLNLAMLVDGPKHSGTFGSHHMLYDSLDNIPWVSAYGPEYQSTKYTIAHEIGHAIGLGHIGVTMKTRLCEYAQELKNVENNDEWASKGGENSPYCYGYGQGKEVYGNVMGSGDQFSEENARPWVWAIQTIRRQTWEYWRVVTTDPGPGAWSSN